MNMTMLYEDRGRLPTAIAFEEWTLKVDVMRMMTAVDVESAGTGQPLKFERWYWAFKFVSRADLYGKVGLFRR